MSDIVFYDASLPLSSSVVTWPGDKPFVRHMHATLEKDGVETSGFTMSAHNGTHIDAPRHFIAGAKGLEAYTFDQLIGPAIVIDLAHVTEKLIQPGHLQGIDFTETPRVFFKTQNSVRRIIDNSEFTTDFVCLAPETARYLVSAGVRMVGIDYLSVDPADSTDEPVHKTLLAEGIVIVEGVRLIDVPPGTYTVTALPLNIADSDGSPCRVVFAAP